MFVYSRVGACVDCSFLFMDYRVAYDGIFSLFRYHHRRLYQSMLPVEKKFGTSQYFDEKIITRTLRRGMPASSIYVHTIYESASLSVFCCFILVARYTERSLHMYVRFL